MWHFLRKQGFTVIELLVVIAVISILAGITSASISTYINKGKASRALGEMEAFKKVVAMAEGLSGKRLQDITNNGWNGWTEGPCVNPPFDLRNISSSSQCYTNWNNALLAIQTAAGPEFSAINNMKRDAWGSPYLLDENEKEFGPTDCRLDTIRSVGPDGVADTGDDILFSMLPHASCP